MNFFFNLTNNITSYNNFKVFHYPPLSVASAPLSDKKYAYQSFEMREGLHNIIYPPPLKDPILSKFKCIFFTSSFKTATYPNISLEFPPLHILVQ